MNKLKRIVTMLILATVALCIPVCAYAETVTFEGIAQKDERITKAQAVTYQGICVVAVEKHGFTNKSQYEEYRETTESEIKHNFPEIETVIITGNPKVMFEIELLNKLDENEKQIAIETLIRQLQQRREPIPFPDEMRNMHN